MCTIEFQLKELVNRYRDVVVNKWFGKTQKFKEFNACKFKIKFFKYVTEKVMNARKT